MELKNNLPLPATKEDQTFLSSLLEAVKEKRKEATTGRRIYTPEKETD